MNIPSKRLNTGIDMPMLGLGVWQLREGQPAKQAVLWALEAGYRLIDTAAMYSNERSVGEAVRESGIPREQIFVTTKIWNTDQSDPKRAFTSSLEKLRLDYIDLYLIHWPVVGHRQATWAALEDFYRQGVAKSVGVSNYTIRHLQELLEQSSMVPAVNQVEFHPFLYQKELLEFCQAHDIALEAYSPLTRGQQLQHPVIAQIAKAHTKTPAQILLRWCVQQSVIAIPKSGNRERIQQNMDVFDFELTPSEMEKLNRLDVRYHTTWDPTGAP